MRKHFKVRPNWLDVLVFAVSMLLSGVVGFSVKPKVTPTEVWIGLLVYLSCLMLVIALSSYINTFVKSKSKELS